MTPIGIGLCRQLRLKIADALARARALLETVHERNRLLGAEAASQRGTSSCAAHLMKLFLLVKELA